MPVRPIGPENSQGKLVQVWHDRGGDCHHSQAYRHGRPTFHPGIRQRITQRRDVVQPPHKKALEQMWYAGVLATSHRENFEKFYDLGERVFPSLKENLSPKSQRDKLCRAAIDRLWVASASEIRRFWDASSAVEVNDWLGTQDLIPARVEDAAGNWYDSWALSDIETRLANLPEPSSQMRIINPFDPAVRDRKRLYRLFGFEYRNEMFVPAANRQWGYYVYPLLEADQFVGRIELKADRSRGQIQVSGFWTELAVSGGRPLSWGKGRTVGLYR